MIIAFDPEISSLRIYFEEKIKRRKKVNKLRRVKKKLKIRKYIH